jgi:hypothetical protein
VDTVAAREERIKRDEEVRSRNHVVGDRVCAVLMIVWIAIIVGGIAVFSH